MACINPDGTLTASAQMMLNALRTPATPVELAQRTERPLFRVRSTLRELAEAGLVEEHEGRYRLTAEGAARIQ
jgi:DNA-binding IclR family transcriptional regulator